MVLTWYNSFLIKRKIIFRIINKFCSNHLCICKGCDKIQGYNDIIHLPHKLHDMGVSTHHDRDEAFVYETVSARKINLSKVLSF